MINKPLQLPVPYIKRMFTEAVFYSQARRLRKIGKRAESSSLDRIRRERSDTGEAGAQASDAVPPMSPYRHGKDAAKSLPTSPTAKGKEPFRSPIMSPSVKGKSLAR